LREKSKQEYGKKEKWSSRVDRRKKKRKGKEEGKPLTLPKRPREHKKKKKKKGKRRARRAPGRKEEKGKKNLLSGTSQPGRKGITAKTDGPGHKRKKKKKKKNKPAPPPKRQHAQENRKGRKGEETDFLLFSGRWERGIRGKRPANEEGKSKVLALLRGKGRGKKPHRVRVRKTGNQARRGKKRRKRATPSQKKEKREKSGRFSGPRGGGRWLIPASRKGRGRSRSTLLDQGERTVGSRCFPQGTKPSKGKRKGRLILRKKKKVLPRESETAAQKPVPPDLAAGGKKRCSADQPDRAGRKGRIAGTRVP